jgi:heptosyltransferase II
VEFDSILVRATNWVGDAVMSIPALQQLRAYHPNARISILARPWVAGLYGRESFCDELIPYQAPKGWAGFGQKWRLASDLKGHRFDCALLLQNAFEAALLVRAARVPVRIGYNLDARGFLLTHAIQPPATGDIPTHQRFYYLELLKRAGVIGAYSLDAPIRLGGRDLAEESGRMLFERAGIKAPVVGVAPGAAYGGAKRWRPERFAQAATRVAKELDATVTIFGSNDEREICSAVADQLELARVAVHNFAGHTSLPELIDMLAACRILVTNDSGPMHIASALGISTVAIFGATDHVATGPTGDQAKIVRVPVECSPCLLRECPIDHRCMTAVTADMVAEASLTLIEGTSRNKTDLGHAKQNCHA